VLGGELGADGLELGPNDSDSLGGALGPALGELVGADDGSEDGLPLGVQ
jgi:hypothetical protein